MKLKVLKTDGGATRRSVTLDASVFGIKPNDHAMWLDVRSIQAARRQGTHKTKERSEVRGGGAKPWRQKGTGRARAGTIRSPLWAGGGRVFGPRPHKYRVNVTRKTKLLARRSALSYKAKDDAIRVLENFSLEVPKTREIVALIEALELKDRKVLLVTGAYDPVLYKSGRNLPKVSILDAASASTLDFMGADILVMQEDAVDEITRLLGNTPENAAEKAPEAETETKSED